MATARSFSETISLDVVVKNGFVKAEDDNLGQQLQEMENNAVPLASRAGLKFYSKNVLEHRVSTQEVIHANTASNIDS